MDVRVKRSKCSGKVDTVQWSVEIDCRNKELELAESGGSRLIWITGRQNTKAMTFEHRTDECPYAHFRIHDERAFSHVCDFDRGGLASVLTAAPCP